MIVNPRHVKKTAGLARPNEDTPLIWTSQYGSVTFNLAGREFPNGGMNEKGLVVETMTLNSTAYESATEKKPAVNEIQWIQYVLDNAATVSDAIKLAKTVKIQKSYAPLHYMACDSLSNCASFEYLRGKLVVHSGARMPFHVLTNDSYNDSLANLWTYQGFGGTEAIPQDASSFSRFALAAENIQNFSSSADRSFAYGMETLERVKNPTGSAHSVWFLLYDPTHLQIRFHTLEAKNDKILRLNALQFD